MYTFSGEKFKNFSRTLQDPTLKFQGRYHKPSKMFAFKPMFWSMLFLQAKQNALFRFLSSFRSHDLYPTFSGHFSLKWHLPLTLKINTETPENESLNTCANQTCALHLWLKDFQGPKSISSTFKALKSDPVNRQTDKRIAFNTTAFHKRRFKLKSKLCIESFL